MNEERIFQMKMDILDQFACAIMPSLVEEDMDAKVTLLLWKKAYVLAEIGLEVKAKRRRPYFNE